MKVIKSNRDVRCTRCGDWIWEGEEMVWVKQVPTNPLLQGKRAWGSFHMDRNCDKKENNDAA